MHHLNTFQRFALVGMLITAGTALAQDLTVKAPPQAAPIAIINAAIHPVSGENIANGYIVFEMGRITKIGAGEASTDQFSPGTRIIDAGGKKHVYPGMVSPYTQLGLTEIQSVPSSIDTSETGRITPEVIAVTAVNPDSTLIPVTRSNGILAAAVFPLGGIVSGQPSVIRLDGWTTADMTIRRSIGQVLSWPNMRTFTAWWMDQTDEDQLKNIKRDTDAITKLFETARAYSDAKAGDPASPTDLRWEGMKPLFADASTKDGQNMPRAKLYIRANSVDQILAAVSFGQVQKLPIVIIGGRDAVLCADVLKKDNIPVIVLGTHNLPQREDEAYDEAYTLPARLHAAGIMFAMSHSDDTAHERNLPYQAAMAVAYGLDPDIALKSVTLWSAQISGVGDEIGSLDLGKSATLIVTDGDPLETTTRISSAFIDGREIDLSNKQTKLAEKYRARYKQGEKR